MKLSLLFEADADNRQLEALFAAGDHDAYQALLRKTLRGEYDGEKIKPRSFRELRAKSAKKNAEALRGHAWRHQGHDLAWIGVHWSPNELSMHEAIRETIDHLKWLGYDPDFWEIEQHIEEDGWAVAHFGVNERLFEDLEANGFLEFRTRGEYPVMLLIDLAP